MKRVKTTELLPFARTLTVTSLLIGNALAHAGVITATSASGPGGVATAFAVTAVPNNDNAAAGNPHLLVFSSVFTSIAPIDAVLTVNPSGGTTEYSGSAVRAANNTGVPWIDFHFTLIPGIAGDGLDFDTPDRDPPPTSSAFSTLVHGEDALDWSGGVVAPGSIVTFTFALDVPDIAGTTFTLRALPSIAVAAAPEPATTALLGIALSAFAFSRRRKPA